MLANVTDRAIVHGYHFHVRFIPKWGEVAPLVVKRARAIGLEVHDDGRELEPRATSLAFVGTRWSRYSHGGLRFDVLEERRALHGDLVSSAGNSGEHPSHGFGLAHPGAIADKFKHELAMDLAVGLWINEGSLTLCRWEDRELDDEVIAEFQVWTALAALSRAAQGLPALGRPTAGSSVVARHSSPAWAPGFESTMAPREGEVRARFFCPRMAVTVQVDLITESPPETEPRGDAEPPPEA
jgi:hypothetical protein